MLFHKTKTIIIVGASRFGAGLAGRMAGQNTRIVVIDQNQAAFRKLPDDYDGYQLLGDGTDVDMLRPDRTVLSSRINRGGKREIVTEKAKIQIHGFLFLYLLVFAAGTFVFCCYGYPVEDSMFEFSSALSTVGLSVGITAADAAPLIHWTATAGMFLGRLEIYVVMAGVARMMWDGRKYLTDRRMR